MKPEPGPGPKWATKGDLYPWLLIAGGLVLTWLVHRADLFDASDPFVVREGGPSVIGFGLIICLDYVLFRLGVPV
jgi:hypothetical protein